MCNKMSFETTKEAKGYAKILSINMKFKSKKMQSKKSHKELIKTTVYLCRICDKHHLTSMKKKIRRDFLKRIGRNS